MTTSRPLLRCSIALGASIAASVLSAPALAGFTYSGRAYAAEVRPILHPTIVVCDTGPLPPQGGYADNSMANANVPLLHAGVMVATTSGAVGLARSTATVAGVTILPGTPAELYALVVRADTSAECGGSKGSSEIQALYFGGHRITVGTEPNQVVDIPGVARLTINEQKMIQDHGYYEFEVNALHLTVIGVADVIVAHAESDVNCSGTPPPCPCDDFISGCGWIRVPSNYASFGFVAGVRDGATTPQVNFHWIDHRTGMVVEATSATAYGPGAGAGSRHFEGPCTVNGQSGFHYSVDVADHGDPGHGFDTIRLDVDNGYSEVGTLGGGNVQLYAPCG